MTTCADEEKQCRARCGTDSEYDFDCDDSGNGAQAFSCACRSTGGWSEAASIPSGFATPLTFDTAPIAPVRNAVNTTTDSQGTQDYCTRERSLCAALCAEGTVPDFDCKDETSKDGSSSSLSSACACKTDEKRSPPSKNPVVGPSNTPAVLEEVMPRNGTCETSKLSCQKSCPEGSRADFTCDSVPMNDGSSLQNFSSSCRCLPLDATQDGPLSGNIQANNEVPTDAGFQAGAKYAIQYMMASLLMLQAAMGIADDAE